MAIRPKIELTAFAFAATAVIFGIAERLGEEWPRLYLQAIGKCGTSSSCTLSLQQIYGTSWSKVVAFDAGVEHEWAEKKVGASLRDFDEYRQGLVLLDAGGRVLQEHYSGINPELTVMQWRPLIRISFAGKDRVWALDAQHPWICVQRPGPDGVRHVSPGKCA